MKTVDHPVSNEGMPHLEQFSIHEPYWVARLIERDPVALPYVPADISRDRLPATWIHQEIDCHDLHVFGESSEPIARAVAAISLYLGRLCGKEAFDLDYSGLSLQSLPEAPDTPFATAVPLAIRLNGLDSFTEHVAQIEDLLSDAEAHGTYARDLVFRSPQIEAEHRQRLRSVPDVAVAIVPADRKDATELPPAHLVFAIAESAPKITLVANPDAIDKDLLTKIAEELKYVLSQADEDPGSALADFTVVTPRERAILDGWNGESRVEHEASNIPRLFEAQADKTPDATALVFRDESLTYRELNARANQLARLLLARGAQRGDLIGVLMERSVEVVVALLGVLKAGAAFVPLDPIYPLRRLAFLADDPKTQKYLSLVELRWMHRLAVIAQDAKPAFIVTQERHLGRVPNVGAQNIVFDGPSALDGIGVENLEAPIGPEDLAYVMYTFGSAGRPKGVMITHSNIDSFLTAIDGPLKSETPGVMLSATSIAFDFSIAELIWPLTRGYTAVLHSDGLAGAPIRRGSRHPNKPIDFSLFFWTVAGRHQASDQVPHRLLLEAARFADEHDFTVRTSERRGGSFGDFFANTSAVSATPGATAKSFALRAESGPQPERTRYITSPGDPELFRRAGQEGAIVLTQLLGQSVETLGKNIDLYRRAWTQSGRAGAGRVAVMLHTLVGEDELAVKEAVRGPMKAYLKGDLSLIRDAAWEFPAFQEMAEEGKTLDEFFAHLSEQGLGELLEFAFERSYATSGLFGTRLRCLALVDRLKEIGVDEIACLIDFGSPDEQVLEHLPLLSDLRFAANPKEDVEDIAALIERHRVTHVVAAPSLATALTWNDRSRNALARVSVMVVGGEAMSVELAHQLRSSVKGRVLNVYGSIETTVWSTSHELTDERGSVPIGKPIANTRLYVMDEHQRLLPIGVPGELVVSGDGVGRGYLNKPELTDACFLRNDRGRMYRTGDVVRMRRDGVLEFLERLDHQVKIRGNHINLPDIESVLQSASGVRKAVVQPQTDASGGQRLVAYVVPVSSAEFRPNDLREFVRARLPECMIPSLIEPMHDLPLTPSGTVDRRALPKTFGRPRPSDPERSLTAPATETQRRLAELWKRLLDVTEIDRTAKFVDLGGHSLLAMRAITEIEKTFATRISVRALLVSSLSQVAAEIDRLTAGRHDHAGRDRARDTESPGLGRLARWFKKKTQRSRS